MTLSPAASAPPPPATGLFPHTNRSPAALHDDIISALSGYDIIMVPGLDGSGPQHWQSHWEILFTENNLTVDRVRQHDWRHPVRAHWRAGLAEAIRGRDQPVLLLAHSLGAVLSAGFRHPAIAGALLVAPADTEQCIHTDRARIRDFSPLPATAPDFPALVVASRNDEWLSFPRARALAAQWNAELFDAGAVGHIGNKAGPGEWTDGLRALRRLLDIIATSPRPPHEHRPRQAEIRIS